MTDMGMMDKGKPVRSKEALMPEGTHWEMDVKITFPVSPGDCNVLHPGDAEIDFANRAVQRMRHQLQHLATHTGGGYLIMPVNKEGQLARRSYG